MNKYNHMLYAFYKKPIQKHKWVESRRIKKDVLGDDSTLVSVGVAVFQSASPYLTCNHLPSAVNKMKILEISRLLTASMKFVAS